MSTGEAHAPAEHHEEGHGHAVPAKVLLNVFFALVLMTILTVAATQFPTGSFEIWISMAIATLKASLVVAYFMHVRYDNPMYAMLFAAGLLFMALFVAFTMMDVAQYQSDLYMMPVAPQ